MNQAALSFGIVFALASASAHVQAQYPMVEKMAAKLVQKYQTSSCEQLAAERKATPSAPMAQAKDKFGELLRQDAKMRTAFLSRVATPIADKMVQCGFIP